MQNSVLFGIFLSLISCEKINTSALSQKFEVSKRTVLRYVDVISAGGLPIVSLPGRFGGYSVPDEYRINCLCAARDGVKLSALNTAITRYKTIAISYADGNKTATRRVDPYAVFLKNGVWHVLAFCRLKNEFRAFKLLRIESLSLTDETFVRRDVDLTSLPLLNGAKKMTECYI